MTFTTWAELLDLIEDYYRRFERLSSMHGSGVFVPEKEEELSSFIGTLQQIYYQHETVAEEETMRREDDDGEKS